jgi:hypothetical protein
MSQRNGENHYPGVVGITENMTTICKSDIILKY